MKLGEMMLMSLQSCLAFAYLLLVQQSKLFLFVLPSLLFVVLQPLLFTLTTSFDLRQR